MIWIIGITWAISAIIMSTLLFYLFFTQKKKFYFYFALIFLLAHFSGLESALYYLNQNLFYWIFSNTPFSIYFFSWLVFVIYSSQYILKNKKLTILIVLFTALILYFAPQCMNYPTACELLWI